MNLAAADLFQAEIARLQAEIERLRLTDAEREVITWAANAMQPECRAILRALLERLSPIAKCESDSPQPSADSRLAALQQLAELDEELGLPRT